MVGARLSEHGLSAMCFLYGTSTFLKPYWLPPVMTIYVSPVERSRTYNTLCGTVRVSTPRTSFVEIDSFPMWTSITSILGASPVVCLMKVFTARHCNQGVFVPLSNFRTEPPNSAIAYVH
jgi:hypothetical protein